MRMPIRGRLVYCLYFRVNSEINRDTRTATLFRLRHVRLALCFCRDVAQHCLGID